MNIKRIVSFTLAVLMVFSLAACKSGGDEWSYYSDTVLVEKENSKTDNGDTTATDGDGKGATTTTTTTTTTKTSSTGKGTVSNTGNTGDGVIVTGDGVKPNISGFKADYIIKAGNTPVDKDLDLKGVTITMMTCGGATTTYMRSVKAFETKYNCKVKIIDLNYATRITQMAAAVAANNAIEICGMQGGDFPTEPIKGLVDPLENALTTADLYDAKKKNLHSIDFNYSQYTSWDNHLYGVCGHGAASSQPMIFYYNKKLFKESGLEDPLTLYKAGKWTWKKIEEMGRIVTDSTKGIYFLDGECAGAVVNSYNPQWISFSDSGIKENLTATRNINALTYLQKLATGNSAIMGPFAFTDDTTRFYEGKSYLYFQSYVYGQQYIRPAINEGLAAFNNDPNNMGIVPIPMADENTEKAYQGGSLDFITCGKGRNPLYAIIWAKFKSAYDSSSANDKNAYSKEEWAVIEALADGNMAIDRLSSFSTSTASANGIVSNFTPDAAKGEDIGQIVNAQRQKVQNCIDTTLAQQK